MRAIFLIFLLFGPVTVSAAPYAAMVVDARSGEVLHSRNADTRLHPASLTKMMTLYVAFDAIEKGEISLDTKVKISRKAASEPPSKLGLKAGQKVALRYLIRAAAVKSANDAATAIGEAISGSEAAFARRMNRMAQAMGMTRSTFKNAHGLTETGHLSTARDMTVLGRHVFYDFPEYYNLFSRRSTNAGVKNVSNTNRRLLNGYKGADGIKTGFTRAAGYNLVASAERGNERVIATVFGGRSVTWRTTRIAELLDMGFQRAPTRVAVKAPRKPVMMAAGSGKTKNTTGLVNKSPRPIGRPSASPAEEVLVAMAGEIKNALAEAAVEDTTIPAAAPAPVLAASLAGAFIRPSPRPVIAQGAASANVVEAAQSTATPTVRPAAKPVVVTRLSTSGGRHWGINVGRYNTRDKAERVLLQTALVEMSTLETALRKVVRSPKGWEANFVGLTEDTADMACRRLEAQNVSCTPVGPG
ncbi:MAG: D-alanyl-D-alanine carboxypeptidase [Silicimonas sp.]|nr:D-alanyl-D-alanine carboxypeptidase [Silicimonas sp.]